MRVAMVVGTYSPRAGGGFTFQDEVIGALTERAPESQHDFVLVGNFSPEFRAAVEDKPRMSLLEYGNPRLQKVERVAASMSQTALGTLRAAGLRSAFDRQLARHGVQFVWFSTQFLAHTDLPYIYTVWDLEHRLHPWFPEFSARGRWLHREREFSHTLQRATLIITPNRTGQKEIETFYGVYPERIRCYAHPTPAFALRAGDEPRPPRPEAVREVGDYVLYPAQLWAHKNHVTVLRALHAIASSGGTPPHAVFVGRDGGNLAHVQGEARRLGLEAKVSFLGFVSREDLVALYRNAMALVYPSFCGPENLPPLEAFAMGVPVIAARWSGAEEQLGDAPIFFEPTDHAALARIVQTVAADPQVRDGLVARGKARSRRWTSPDYVDAVLRDLDQFAAIRAAWP